MTSRQHALCLRRSLGFCLGAYFMGLGIALATNAHLGTTPISSLPYVCSFILPMSFGELTFVINALMVAAQKLLLGPAFERRSLLQLPAVLVFSLFIDVNMWLTRPLVKDVYGLQVLLCVAGSLVLAVGIGLCVVSRATVMPGEGLVLVFTQLSHGQFGKIKVMFDCSLVVMSAGLSLLVLHGLEGLGEGTLLSAILTGNFVRLLSPWFERIRPFFG